MSCAAQEGAKIAQCILGLTLHMICYRKDAIPKHPSQHLSGHTGKRLHTRYNLFCLILFLLSSCAHLQRTACGLDVDALDFFLFFVYFPSWFPCKPSRKCCVTVLMLKANELEMRNDLLCFILQRFNRHAYRNNDVQSQHTPVRVRLRIAVCGCEPVCVGDLVFRCV